MSDEQARAGDSPLLAEVVGGVGWVTFNRPEQRNAMNLAMKQLLTTSLAELNADPEVRVIVLTGNGPSFCAGNDLREGSTGLEGHALTSPRERITTALDRVTKPVIAAVNGPAYAGGFELALACDLRVASTSAIFCLSEVRIGSIPGGGGTQRLPHTVSSAVAAKLIFTGQPIDGDEAYRTGLVSDLFSPEEFVVKVSELANTVAANAPLALIAAKRALRGGLENAAGLALERTLWETVAMTQDYREARAAFRERRPPTFTGS
ncbi:MAG: enoyl-CoA hydratase/isomerase family protein [Acidimicrobiales bacterium]